MSKTVAVARLRPSMPRSHALRCQSSGARCTCAATTMPLRRSGISVFLDTANETVPFPLPCPPAVTVSHGTLVVADTKALSPAEQGTGGA